MASYGSNRRRLHTGRAVAFTAWAAIVTAVSTGGGGTDRGAGRRDRQSVAGPVGLAAWGMGSITLAGYVFARRDV
ncbi:hypothetical protein K0651_06935 [Ornithinimicrobium sp. Arc0846-15]|nr:hypothetical protein [Ornithinimicrobium laminariae]